MSFITKKFWNGSEWVEELTTFQSKKVTEGVRSNWHGIMGKEDDIPSWDKDAKPEDRVFKVKSGKVGMINASEEVVEALEVYLKEGSAPVMSFEDSQIPRS